MYKNILLPLDGSEAAEEAIPTAIDLARIFDAKITLIQIIEILSLMKENREDEAKILLERGDKYLNLIKERIEDNGGSANVVMETGKPSLKICEHAKHHVDLIILCSHGAGAFESWAVGSVSQKILRHSTKPVLLLKPPIVSPLKGKAVLVVDDEVDILEAVEEHLDMCIVYKASDYNSASQYLENRTFDIVILDIMGVNGFELLKESVLRGFATVMLTAHALSSEALEKSAKLGAVSFLPKENMFQLKEFLEDVVEGEGRPVWRELFDRLGDYFLELFGPGWKKKEMLLRGLEDAFREESRNEEDKV